MVRHYDHGAIGTTPGGGNYRPALSEADREARNLFQHFAREAGQAVTVDAIGNMFASVRGRISPYRR